MRTYIISVYALDTNKTQEETNKESLKSMNKIPKKEEVMILGDFNRKIGHEIISGIENRFNEVTQPKYTY